ncbi:hypothetical protein U732_556 [Clostridium argentinense CDC 2741]|uniref:Uncharacterized protein n=1 Tax=Clostridium argentinense CDC 2741 TaxID=1418104 RepID=A0A0C1UC11_9CLOT|nr:hypothetical protein U732_556 [Clostridium argentinense CDC 2741]
MKKLIDTVKTVLGAIVIGGLVNGRDLAEEVEGIK